MSTTALFVELLVIGLGVTIWLALLIAAVFGYTFSNFASNVSIFALAPIFGIAYLLGIIIDRIAYELFSGLENRIRNRIIVVSGSSPTTQAQERFILTNSELLRDQIIYNRSRLRICRSWVINFILIAFSSAIWSYVTKLYNAFILSLLGVIFALVTFWVWRKLSEDYYYNIKASYEYLTNISPSEQTS
jgi:hypothetical protein